jgi:photosystem II stability/assembly factor-like uncharacterized protein
MGMSTRLMIAMPNSLLTFESSKEGWKKKTHQFSHPQCIAFDAGNSNRAYCGTFGDGLWKTDDGGQSWNSVGKTGISSKDVMSVSVSSLERESNGGFNTVYVGTEPTVVYRSNDGGETWQKMSSINNLKSSSSWSFPPRPWTHHVRWIESDVNKPGYVYVAIEAGALVQSHDGGRTWIDKVDGGPYDTHTMTTHRHMPGRLYSAAGDGYFESYDYGQSWKRSTAAVLGHHGYLFGLTVDSGNPQTIIVSASQWAGQAHFLEAAESVIYRRTSYANGKDVVDGKEEWKLLSNGLPKPTGTLISILGANPKIAGEFYAVNNRGIFCSTDSGNSWKMLNDGIKWPKEYLSQHPRSLVVQEDT